MIKKILLIIVFAFVILPVGSVGATDLLNNACSSLPKGQTSPVCTQNSQQQNVAGPGDLNTGNPVTGSSGVIQTTANIMGLLTGILAVVMIVVSGYQYVTAGGNFAGQRSGDNPSKAKKARANLTAAVIGLIVVALAWSIVTYVVQKIVQ